MSVEINYSTQYGAQILADRITAYWFDRGVTVKCEIVKTRFSRPDRADTDYGVRSNIGMYEPRGMR